MKIIEIIKRLDEICNKAKAEQRDLTNSEADECERLTEKIEELQDVPITRQTR